MAQNGLERFLGGSLGSVLVKLVFVSLLVGATMAFLGLSPIGLAEGFFRFIRRIVESGFDAIGEVGRWLVSGAIIVIPVFLLLRLLRGGR